MDKKWILILIFLIVGCCCLFYVVETSPTVGNAITVVNKTIVSLPDEFSIENKENAYSTLINKNTNEKIIIKDLGKKDSALDNFKEKSINLSKNPDIIHVNNSTLNINNITTYKIDYQNITKENNSDLSNVYIFTCNHTFLIKLENYNNSTKLNNNLDYVITHMTPDFKQSQD
ncbi:MAG: hypothetical protein ACI389_03580 [Methanobrevibacter sp.]|uniref:hypothetical protein n=1 Tax=Methanobrevibacter sp. TaxID=66852 RepID=UPI003EFF6BE1